MYIYTINLCIWDLQCDVRDIRNQFFYIENVYVILKNSWVALPLTRFTKYYWISLKYKKCTLMAIWDPNDMKLIAKNKTKIPTKKILK